MKSLCLVSLRLLLGLSLSVVASGPGWSEGAEGSLEPSPPAANVHLVSHHGDHYFWRGAGPLPETLAVLATGGKNKNHEVTLIDLRHPDNSDDRSGRFGRLSPAAEKAMAAKLGIRYISISALDAKLLATLDDAFERGDVYIHCMYGVNRTGFAVGRYATASHKELERTGCGARDWRDGVKFQERIERSFTK